MSRIIKDIPQNHYISKIMSKETYTFLNLYKQYAITSRALLVDYKFQLFVKAGKKEEPFDKSSDDEAMLIRSSIALDLLRTTMMTIEDLGAICVCLNGDLKLFQKEISHWGQSKAERFFVRSSKGLSDNEILDLLSCPKKEDSNLSENDKKLLEEVYNKNIKIVRSLFEKISQFIELHKHIYAANKHGNRVFTNFKKISGYDEFDTLLSCVYNSKNPSKVRGMLTGDAALKKQISLLNSMIVLTRDIIHSKIVMAECDGKKSILHTYYEVNSKEKERLEKINEKINKNNSRANITCNLECQISSRVLEKFQKFYSEGWELAQDQNNEKKII